MRKQTGLQAAPGFFFMAPHPLLHMVSRERSLSLRNAEKGDPATRCTDSRPHAETVSRDRRRRLRRLGTPRAELARSAGYAPVVLERRGSRPAVLFVRAERVEALAGAPSSITPIATWRADVACAGRSRGTGFRHDARIVHRVAGLPSPHCGERVTVPYSRMWEKGMRRHKKKPGA